MPIEKFVLNQLINNIQKFIWWKDLDSKFIGCNEELLGLLGLNDVSEIIGKSDYDFFSKEEADFFVKIDQEIIATKKPQINFEECITTPDNDTRWISTSKLPYYNDKNEIIGTIGWFNDITAVKEMQITIDENNKALVDYSIQLEQANRDLELVNIDLEKFTYAASHDLKEPLLTIKSFAALLKKKEIEALDEESNKYIDIICESATRMGTLINDVLNYARSGHTQAVAEYVDIKDIVENKLLDLNQMISAKSAIVNINLPTEKVNCYPQLIGLVFYNLINNGIKFNDSNQPIVDCNYKEDENNWTFSIQDNGIGIDSKYEKKIFKPFNRLVGKKYEGSGIGLSICKRITTLHNGNIWLKKSQKGETIFHFSVSKNIKTEKQSE